MSFTNINLQKRLILQNIEDITKQFNSCIETLKNQNIDQVQLEHTLFNSVVGSLARDDPPNEESQDREAEKKIIDTIHTQFDSKKKSLLERLRTVEGNFIQEKERVITKVLDAQDENSLFDCLSFNHFSVLATLFSSDDNYFIDFEIPNFEEPPIKKRRTEKSSYQPKYEKKNLKPEELAVSSSADPPTPVHPLPQQMTLQTDETQNQNSKKINPSPSPIPVAKNLPLFMEQSPLEKRAPKPRKRKIHFPLVHSIPTQAIDKEPTNSNSSSSNSLEGKENPVITTTTTNILSSNNAKDSNLTTLQEEVEATMAKMKIGPQHQTIQAKKSSPILPENAKNVVMPVENNAKIAENNADSFSKFEIQQSKNEKMEVEIEEKSIPKPITINSNNIFNGIDNKGNRKAVSDDISDSRDEDEESFSLDASRIQQLELQKPEKIAPTSGVTSSAKISKEDSSTKKTETPERIEKNEKQEKIDQKLDAKVEKHEKTEKHEIKPQHKVEPLKKENETVAKKGNIFLKKTTAIGATIPSAATKLNKTKTLFNNIANSKQNDPNSSASGTSVTASTTITGKSKLFGKQAHPPVIPPKLGVVGANAQKKNPINSAANPPANSSTHHLQNSTNALKKPVTANPIPNFQHSTNLQQQQQQQAVQPQTATLQQQQNPSSQDPMSILLPPNHPMPEWAHGEGLKLALKENERLMPDSIFQSAFSLSCDLEEIFGKSRQVRPRTSSAHWTTPIKMKSKKKSS